MSTEPEKVIVAPVTVIAPTEPVVAPKVGDPHTAPRTTAEDDRMTQGQRKVNLIWESTQAIIAITVTLATLWVAGSMAVKGTNEGAFLLLSNAFFLVISVYLHRTNSTKIGGVQKGDTGR